MLYDLYVNKQEKIEDLNDIITKGKNIFKWKVHINWIEGFQIYKLNKNVMKSHMKSKE